MDFLIDNNIEFDLPALKAASTRFGSASNAVRGSPQIASAGRPAVRSGGRSARPRRRHRGLQFLQWFIEEQVEEEAKIQPLLDLVDSGINLFQAEPLLDAFE